MKYKLLFINILFLLSLSLNNKTVINTSYNKYLSSYDKVLVKTNINYNINKLDENNTFQKDVKLRLTTYKYIYSIDSVLKDNYHNLSLVKEEERNIKRLFSDKQLKKIDSIKTKSDIEELSQSNNAICNEDKCEVLFPTVFYLEEKEVPTDYQKQKVLLRGVIKVNYDTKDQIIITSVELKSLDENLSMEYGEYDLDDLISTSYEKANELWSKKENIMYREKEENTLGINLFGKKGTIDFIIKNYVNDKTNIIAVTKEKVKYKVLVKNIGTLSAVDSIVTSVVPEGFKYVENSANNNGVYDNGEIKWNVSKLDNNKSIELSYEAYAEPNSIIGKDYVSEASISNYALDNRLDSNRVNVKLLFLNPDISIPIIIIGMFITLFSIMMIFLKKKK
ncbi:MAG: DUF11 domain-containing protein [Bacilli bacterium]|nr:DUF11 domain-containing protein [Bacilli bacterium]